MKVRFKKLTETAVIPTKSHAGDAGFDLTATSFKIDETGAFVYGFGIAVEIPSGYVGLVFPRSSISKKDLLLSNAVGVIDSGYRGEIMAKFKPSLVSVEIGLSGANIKEYDGNEEDKWDMFRDAITFHGRDASYPDVSKGCRPFPPRLYEVGDRAAQLIIMPYPEIEFEEATELSITERNTGSYGSTGA